MIEATRADGLAGLILGWRDAYVDRLRQIQNLSLRLRRIEEERQREEASLLRAVLNVLDHFDGTSRQIQEALTDEDLKARKVLKSFQVLRKQLAAALRPAGVLPMSMESDEFVAGLHKAVGVEDSDACPEGHILRVVKPGYYWKDKILRSAEVVLCGQPVEPQPPADTE